MNHQTRATGNLERRIHDAERNLFAAVGADVDEFFLELAQTGLAPEAFTEPDCRRQQAPRLPGRRCCLGGSLRNEFCCGRAGRRGDRMANIA